MSKLVPKYKVGDMVMVMPRKDHQKRISPGYTDNMLCYENHVVEIIQVESTEHLNVPCYVLRDAGGYTWREDWLSDRPMKLEAIEELLR